MKTKKQIAYDTTALVKELINYSSTQYYTCILTYANNWLMGKGYTKAEILNLTQGRWFWTWFLIKWDQNMVDAVKYHSLNDYLSILDDEASQAIEKILLAHQDIVFNKLNVPPLVLRHSNKPNTSK